MHAFVDLVISFLRLIFKKVIMQLSYINNLRQCFSNETLKKNWLSDCLSLNSNIEAKHFLINFFLHHSFSLIFYIF